MDRVNMLADLITHYLQGEAGLVTVDRAAMHQQASWLINCHQILVPVDQRALFTLCHCRSRWVFTMSCGRI